MVGLIIVVIVAGEESRHSAMETLEFSTTTHSVNIKSAVCGFMAADRVSAPRSRDYKREGSPIFGSTLIRADTIKKVG